MASKLTDDDLRDAIKGVATAPKPSHIRVTPNWVAAFRSGYASVGPKHKMADWWVHDLRWNIAPDVLSRWLGNEGAPHG